jgi:serine/threonine-protein kinase
LLFGIIALQVDFISRDQLIAAMAAWVVEKKKPLGQILCEQGALSSEDHEAIESLVRRHLLRHDNDPERSLAALSAIDQRLRDDLSRIADSEVQASLPRLSATRQETETTVSYVGSPTTPGGRFRVLRPHARGGLGVVSVALDNELHREVAVKEIQERYAGEEQSRARFTLEAEITGGLEHPGIVPVYGLGHHPDGRPFYVMRFVRGESLKEAILRFHGGSSPERAGGGSGARIGPRARSRRTPGAHATALPLRRLLSRFLDVCNAIAYAHSRGVLHRDIKPGNILLGPYGETLVVDWGLAKIVGRDDIGTSDRNAEPTLRPPSASGTGETVAGTAVGTPVFMSPEQAEGRLNLLGAASDVYSLGATLYAVLTGRAPFDGALAVDVLPKVQRGDFARPRALDSGIPKALEAICLTAMALKPADRYASPRALAEDVEHFLADEPVSAYREPWPDRARRWARKHRTLVTSAAAVVVLGLLGSFGFAAVVTGKNRELARQTQRAEARQKMAIDAVKRFRDVVVEEPVLKYNPALQELRKKLLKEPLVFFRSLRQQLHGDEDIRPEALARLARAAYEYAQLTEEIGDIQDGLRSHVESLAIWEKLVRDHPAKTDYWRGLATVEDSRGKMLSGTGYPVQAQESYGKALAIWERLAHENPSATECQRGLAASHNNVGLLQRETGNPDQALESFGKALAIQERMVREHPGVTEFQSDLAASHANIGALIRRKTGHPEQALESYGKALAIQERLAREHPNVTRFQSDLAASGHNIGMLQRETGYPEQALESCTKSMAIQERLAREYPSVTKFQSDLAISYNNIGVLHSEIGRPDQALNSYGKALAIRERLARENPTVTELQSDLAASHYMIGLLMSTTGHTDQALDSYAKAVAIGEWLARHNPSVTQFQRALALGHNNIGVLQSETGHPDQALLSYGKALAIRERLARENPESPDDASSLGGTLNNMATINVDAKQFEQARDQLQQAISWQKKALSANPRHPAYRQFLVNHLTNLIEAAKGLGKADEAGAAQRELDELVASDPAMAALDQRLAAVIRGDATKDNRERLELADRAYEKRLYAACTRLYGEAFEADSNVAENRQAQHRYNAACAAVLAAGVKSTPTLPSPAKGEEKFRSQARAWLEAELAAWTKLLASANREQRRAIAETLRHWQQDTDLASVRDEAALAKLREDERKAWMSLWANVDALLAKARKP